MTVQSTDATSAIEDKTETGQQDSTVKKVPPRTWFKIGIAVLVVTLLALYLLRNVLLGTPWRPVTTWERKAQSTPSSTSALQNSTFPCCAAKNIFEKGIVPTSPKPVQNDMLWAEHLFIFFPVWAGDMPALLKESFEPLMRPSFSGEHVSFFDKKDLSGRTAHVVVMMGMPAIIYRWYFHAHSVKSLERNLLGIVGIAPVNEPLIGLTGGMKAAYATKWLVKLKLPGTRAG